MPITESVKKSLRVGLRRRAENARVKDALKNSMTKVTATTLPQTFSAIDKAVKSGIVHANKAARLKSKLAKRFGSPPTKKATKRKGLKDRHSKRG